MITEKDARAGAARDMGFLAELDFQIRDNHKLTSEVVRLEDENAKMRKLVKEAHLCMVNEGCCEDCYATHGECPIEKEMRELGIEVD